MGQIDYNSLIVDPDFRKLTPGAQQKVLAAHDADFAALSAPAQMKLISAIPVAENNDSNNNLGQPQTVGDKTLRVGQEALLGGLTGFGLPQFPETDDDRNSTFAGRPFNYLGNLWGGVQNKFTQVANKYDTGSPLKDSLNMSLAPFTAMKSIGEGLGQLSSQQFQKTKEEYNAGNPVRAAIHLGGTLFPVTAGVANAETGLVQAISQKDFPAAANAVGNLGGQAAAIYAGAEPAATDAAVTTTGRFVNAALPGTPYSQEQLFRKAIRPSIKRGESFDQAVSATLPDLQRIFNTADEPTLQGYTNALAKERKSVWAQSNKLKPNANPMIDGHDVYSSMVGSISKRTNLINISDAKAVHNLAEGYLEKDVAGNLLKNPNLASAQPFVGKQIPLSDAEEFLQDVHSQLDPYYTADTFQQANMARSNSMTAAMEAEADALRNGIHSNLANPELRQRYGFLSEIQQQAKRRIQQVKNQALNDMPDRGTKIWAAVKTLRAGLTGDPEQALEGAVGMAANSALKRANTPDALLQEAFGNKIFGREMPRGVVGPAVTVNATTPFVQWRYDDEAGQLVPVEPSQPLRFSY